MGGEGLKRRVRAGLRLLGLGLLAAALGAVVFVLAMAVALPDEPRLPFWAAGVTILALLVLAGAVLRRLAPPTWPLAAVIGGDCSERSSLSTRFRPAARRFRGACGG